MRRVNLLFCAAFLMQLGGSAAGVGVSVLAKKGFDASIWGLAIIGVVGTASYAITCFALGSVARKVDPYRFIFVGPALYALVFTAAIFATETWHLVLVFLCGGFASGIFWPMIEAVISEGSMGQRLNRRFGLFNISWSSADAIGAALGGGLYMLWNRLPFVVLVASMGGVLACAALARRKAVIRDEETLPRHFEAHAHVTDVPRPTKDSFLGAAFVSNFIAQGVTNVLRSIFAAPAVDIFRMSGGSIGLALGVYNGLRTLTFVLLREWPNWHYRPRLFLAFSGMLAFGMVGILAAGHVPAMGPAVALVFISFAAAGVGSGMIYYSSIFYSVNAAEVAATHTRLHEAVLGAGGAAIVLGAGGFSSLLSSGILPVVPSVTSLQLSPFGFSAAAVGVGMVISNVLFVRILRPAQPAGAVEA